MKEKHKSRLFLCLLSFYILILPVAAARTCFAENYPEIENIDPSLYLTAKQQFFHRDGGFVLLSSDGNKKSMAAMLDKDGNPDLSFSRPSQNFKFVYQAACLNGDYLYLAGLTPDTDTNAIIGRLNLKTKELTENRIVGCSFDFTRDFNVDADGRITLVAVPAGEKLDAGTKASAYLFKETNGAAITPEKPKPESSSNSGSETSESSASSNASYDPVPDLPAAMNTYHFEKPVTVELLQAALNANKKGETVRVFSMYDKKEIKSGFVGTGQIVQTILNGKTETAYTAVIPGDLDGSGTITDYDYRLLCDYFTQTAAGSTPVLSGPYLEAAKLSGGNNPETGDLLKIKRLSKQVDD